MSGTRTDVVVSRRMKRRAVAVGVLARWAWSDEVVKSDETTNGGKDGETVVQRLRSGGAKSGGREERDERDEVQKVVAGSVEYFKALQAAAKLERSCRRAGRGVWVKRGGRARPRRRRAGVSLG